MLRMKPTRIELNSRDYQWHNVRHENRQKQRAKGSELASTTPSQRPLTSVRLSEDMNLPNRCPSPSSSEGSDIVAAPQMPVFSKRPDMRKFWAGVMAGAGVLPEIQSTHAIRPVQMSEPSDLIAGLQSARGSIEIGEYEDVISYGETGRFARSYDMTESSGSEDKNWTTHYDEHVAPRKACRCWGCRRRISGIARRRHDSGVFRTRPAHASFVHFLLCSSPPSQ